MFSGWFSATERKVAERYTAEITAYNLGMLLHHLDKQLILNRYSGSLQADVCPPTRRHGGPPRPHQLNIPRALSPWFTLERRDVLFGCFPRGALSEYAYNDDTMKSLPEFVCRSQSQWRIHDLADNAGLVASQA
jgi:hypothetical protein